MMATLPGSKVRTGAVRRHMTEFIQSDSIFVYLQGREVFSGTIQLQSVHFSPFHFWFHCVKTCSIAWVFFARFCYVKLVLKSWKKYNNVAKSSTVLREVIFCSGTAVEELTVSLEVEVLEGRYPVSIVPLFSRVILFCIFAGCLEILKIFRN